MRRSYTKRELLQQVSLNATGFLLSACDRTADIGSGGPVENEAQSSGKDSGGRTQDHAPSIGAARTAEPQGRNVAFLHRGDPQYEPLRQGFNRRVQKRPRVIALCQNTQGVSEAVKYAAQNRLPIAIKSGGHSFEGFSSNDDGLVINLSPMHGVQWRDDTVIQVGPGCTLSHLYDQLLPKKRLLPAGSCGGVGIGGLTLGGGYGFFSRKYGLTCDSLQEVTLVDGKGAVRSSKADPELLWACRGGGNGSFGVVTEMVFQTHPAPTWFYSNRFTAAPLDTARANKILKRWFDIAAHLPETCFSAYVLNGKHLTILVTDYEAPTKPVQAALEDLRGLTDDATIGKPRATARALKNYYGASAPVYFKNSSAGSYHGYADIQGCIAAVLDSVVSRPGLIFQVNALGGNIAQPSFAQASCYPHRTRPFLAELQSYWNRPGYEESLLARCRDIQRLLKESGVTAHYANYPNIEFEDWQHAYYGESYPRLQAVKRKYDPDNRFRYDQSVRG